MAPQTPAILRQWNRRLRRRWWDAFLQRLWPLLRPALGLVGLLTILGLIYPPRAPRLPVEKTLEHPAATISFIAPRRLRYRTSTENLLTVQVERGDTARNMPLHITISGETSGLLISDQQGRPLTHPLEITVPAEENFAAGYQLSLDRLRWYKQEANIQVAIRGTGLQAGETRLELPFEGMLSYLLRRVLNWFGSSNGIVLSLLVFLLNWWKDKVKDDRTDATKALEQLENMETLWQGGIFDATTRFDQLYQQYSSTLAVYPELARRANLVNKSLLSRAGHFIENASDALSRKDTNEAIRILRLLEHLYSTANDLDIQQSRERQTCAAWIDYLSRPNTTILRETVQFTWDTWDVQAKEMVLYALPNLFESDPEAVVDTFSIAPHMRRLLRDASLREKFHQRTQSGHPTEPPSSASAGLPRDTYVRALSKRLVDMGSRPEVELISLPTLFRKLDERQFTAWRNLLEYPLRNPITLAQASADFFPSAVIPLLERHNALVIVCRDGYEAQLTTCLAARHLRKPLNTLTSSTFPLMLPIHRDDLRSVLSQETILLDSLTCHVAHQWLELLIEQPELFLDLHQEDQRLLTRLMVHAHGNLNDWLAHWYDQENLAHATKGIENDTARATANHHIICSRLLVERIRRYCTEDDIMVRPPGAAEVRRWFTLRPSGYEKTCLILTVDANARNMDVLPFVRMITHQYTAQASKRVQLLALIPNTTLEGKERKRHHILSWDDKELTGIIDTWVRLLQENPQNGEGENFDYPDLDKLFDEFELPAIATSTGLLPKNLLVQRAEGSLGRLIELTEGAIEAHLNAARGGDNGLLTISDLCRAGIPIQEEDSHDS